MSRLLRRRNLVGVFGKHLISGERCLTGCSNLSGDGARLVFADLGCFCCSSCGRGAGVHRNSPLLESKNWWRPTGSEPVAPLALGPGAATRGSPSSPLPRARWVGPGRRHRGAGRSAEGPEAYTYATTGSMCGSRAEARAHDCSRTVPCYNVAMQRNPRKQTARRHSPSATATFGYARVESILAKVFDAEDAQRGAFRGRLKHFRKLGIPAEILARDPACNTQRRTYFNCSSPSSSPSSTSIRP